MSHRETTLAILAGSTETERVLMVLVATAEGSAVELRQQSWGEGIGWFTQSHVHLDPQQVAELKQTLGPTSRGTTRRGCANPSSGGFVPRVIHAESA